MPASRRCGGGSDHREYAMALGAFSISLAVKDIRASKNFYETLGFIETGGNIDRSAP
jgi:hypothetical protein